jgi:hypothetical protein
MKTVVITEDFTGYPSGKKASFAKGAEVSVPDAFADLIVAKGHAREKVAPVPAKAEPKTLASKDAPREAL